MSIITMRPSTLEPLGLGTVHSFFSRGRLPVTPEALVDRVFGPVDERGALVISGASGIVGAGKTMQLGSRLIPLGVPVVALDLPGAPDGLGGQYAGLVAAFGPARAQQLMQSVFRLSYDGKSLPPQLAGFRPRFLLEAIPELLELKRAHYALFRQAFPDIAIRSVTSGFPASQLGVGIAHPAFPHQINKVWEIVEPEPSDITKLLWSLGLIPVAVSDHWSFVLDVLFCGITLAACRFNELSNMPYWKVDKYARRLLGPNPLRAHDAIGTKGATFLTWSCLHHLAEVYGPLFTPAEAMVERKDTGQSWYPLNHLRPLVNWNLTAAEEDEFAIHLLGPMFQMAALLLHERRGSLAAINAIGELCAQFRRGIVAELRGQGSAKAIRLVERFHKRRPEARLPWHPEALEDMESPEWQQLYVNAEHDGEVGVVTISREAYNDDVDAELNRAVDWLKAAGIERVILTSDFHLSTQMVGADTANFYEALSNADEGIRICTQWPTTARRFHDEFKVSVAFLAGKRALGGMLELLLHCHALVAVDGSQLGMPEVTLPIVPGVEGCHWPFRKARPADWPRLFRLLLNGQPVKASQALGWLVDVAAPMDQALAAAWSIARGEGQGVPIRAVNPEALDGFPTAVESAWLEADSQATDEGRKAIFDLIRRACTVSLAEALPLQALVAGNTIASKAVAQGKIGQALQKAMTV